MSLREKYKTFTFKGLLVLDKNFNECPGNKIRKKFTFMGRKGGIFTIAPVKVL